MSRCGLLVVLLAMSVLLLPQSPSYSLVTFERAYGDPNFYDEGRCVQQTADGGYVISGWGAFHLMKVDSAGDSLWSRLYAVPGSTHVYMACARQTADGGYISTGSFWLQGSPDHDAILIKTDSLGYAEWSKTFGGDETDGGNWVEQTLDGGYIVVGVARSVSDVVGDIWLIKTNSAGDTLWTRTYGDTLLDQGDAVKQTSDGGFIVAGWTTVAPGMPPSTRVVLLKVDSSGNPIWSRSYGLADRQSIGSSVQQTSDGGYVVAGTINRWTDEQACLIKTNSLGDSVWSNTFSGKRFSEGYSVQQTLDGGYIVAGTTVDSLLENTDAYLVKTDGLGSVQWDTTYGGLGPQETFSVWHTSDTGYAFVGRTGWFGQHTNDVLLIRTDKRGWIVPKMDFGVVSLDSPPDTVFPDSMYEVMATVRSYSNKLDTVLIVASINGHTDTLWESGLDPGSSIQAHLPNWQVPPTDSTAYIMTVCTHHSDDIDTTNDSMQKEIFAYNPTGVEEQLDRRGEFGFHLYQNEPNPFHRSTVIQYSLATQCDVTLSVYDVTGSLMGELVDERQGAGVFRVQWIAESHADGIYFCRLMAGNLTETRKMVLVR